MPVSSEVVSDLVVAAVDALRDSVVVDPSAHGMGVRGVAFVGVLDGGNAVDVVRVVPLVPCLRNAGMEVRKGSLREASIGRSCMRSRCMLCRRDGSRRNT